MTVEELWEQMKEVPLFNGCYDAKHGKEDFMYGIQTVMEYIADNISNVERDNFDKNFIDNLLTSQEKVL